MNIINGIRNGVSWLGQTAVTAAWLGTKKVVSQLLHPNSNLPAAIAAIGMAAALCMDPESVCYLALTPAYCIGRLFSDAHFWISGYGWGHPIFRVSKAEYLNLKNDLVYTQTATRSDYILGSFLAASIIPTIGFAYCKALPIMYKKVREVVRNFLIEPVPFVVPGWSQSLDQWCNQAQNTNEYPHRLEAARRMKLTWALGGDVLDLSDLPLSSLPEDGWDSLTNLTDLYLNMSYYPPLHLPNMNMPSLRINGDKYSRYLWKRGKALEIIGLPRDAFQLYTQAAQLGDLLERLEVARCYLTGIGVSPDPQMAEYWNPDLLPLPT